MTSSATAVQSIGWPETLKNYVQNGWEKMQESHTILFTIALYSGCGFVLGYFCRRYAHFLVFLIILAMGVSLLQQLDYISFTIHWAKIYTFLGIQNVDVSDMSIVTYIFGLAKDNFAGMVSLVIGFLLGLRFG